MSQRKKLARCGSEKAYHGAAATDAYDDVLVYLLGQLGLVVQAVCSVQIMLSKKKKKSTSYYLP